MPTEAARNTLGSLEHDGTERIVRGEFFLGHFCHISVACHSGIYRSGVAHLQQQAHAEFAA